jgi:cytochrome c-type biogenesis protein CcmH
MDVAASPFLPFGVFVLTAALAALAAAWILNRALRAPAPEADPETRVYRDQLAELDRDHSDGRITQSGLDGARLEIGRRLAALATRVQPATDKPAGKQAIGMLAGAVALGTGAIYLATGNPNYGDQPFEARREALLARPATSLNDQELIALLQADAQKNKQDPRPHFFLGQVLASQGRDSDAIRAFQAALRRDPKSADALVGAGASLVRLSDGKIGPEALGAFQAANALEPKAMLPRFYLALGQWQTGDQKAALEAWRTVWAELPKDGQERFELSVRVAQALSVLDRGPGAQGVTDMAALSAADRGNMVEGMLNQRAERLRAAPRDIGLRLSLVRATVTMGQRQRASDLLDQGNTLFAGDDFVQAVLTAARGGLLGPAETTGEAKTQ